jgi:hypothetical protein
MKEGIKRTGSKSEGSQTERGSKGKRIKTQEEERKGGEFRMRI